MFNTKVIQGQGTSVRFSSSSKFGFPRVYSPTMPPQQAENFDGRRYARHAGRPTAAHNVRSAAPAHPYPPWPKRLAQIRPHVLDRARAPVHQPRAHHLLILRGKLVRKLQMVRSGRPRLAAVRARPVSVRLQNERRAEPR